MFDHPSLQLGLSPAGVFWSAYLGGVITLLVWWAL